MPEHSEFINQANTNARGTVEIQTGISFRDGILTSVTEDGFRVSVCMREDRCFNVKMKTDLLLLV